MIGVFDSGFGGLSVWKELRRALPAESLAYYGDGKNCPYGDKPAGEVRGYVEEGVKLLISRGAKLIVMACNAATAAAIDHLRATYDIPFIGMEPAVKPAAEQTKTGVIGILATAGTLKGRLFRETVAKYGAEVKVITGVGEGFVELVEAGREDSPEAAEAARRALKPMLDAGADRIVLGCTHYPFMERAMRSVIGDRDVRLIDPAPAIARRAAQVLHEKGLETASESVAQYEFHTAADETYRRRLEAKAAEMA